MDNCAKTKSSEMIILNLRGEKMTIYKSTIMLSESNVLKNLIGEGEINSPNNRHEDGSIFIDCDKEDMTLFLGYLETGYMKSKHCNKKYFREICNKFGVNFEDKSKKCLKLELSRFLKAIQDFLDKITFDDGLLGLNCCHRIVIEIVRCDILPECYCNKVKDKPDPYITHSMLVPRRVGNELLYLSYLNPNMSEFFSVLKKDNYLIEATVGKELGSSLLCSFVFK